MSQKPIDSWISSPGSENCKIRDIPKIPPNTRIADACLIVDQEGILWWVDPQAKIIVKVNFD
jgi:hypothetical protein